MKATYQPFKLVEEELVAYFDLRSISEEDPNAPPPPSRLEWARLYRKLEGRDFSLDGYKPLEALYADDHPYIVVMKPAQVGVSEWAVTEALHTLDVGHRYYQTKSDGLNIGYLFPSKDALSDFTKERINGLKSESDYLNGLFTSFDDLGFKQIRKAFFYLRGAWSTRALKSFKADKLIFDEYDEMLPRAISLAVKRMRHSELQHQRRLSTPTYPGKGIHELYLQSDQLYWETFCSECDEWNELDFFRDVRVAGQPYEEWKLWTKDRILKSKIKVHCPSCGEDYTDQDRFEHGRWVARAPEITSMRGYHVPWWAFRSVKLNEIAANAVSEIPEEVEEFYRSDLGIPYEPGGSRITDEMLKKLSADLPGGRLPENVIWKQTTMGIDVGKRFHYRISSTGPDGERYVRAMGAVRAWIDLDNLMAEYNVRSCVIDSQPEMHTCSTWAGKPEHVGKVLRAYYPNAKALQGKLFRASGSDNPDIESGMIQVNRTMAMDVVYNVVATGKEHWPAHIHNSEEVMAHMKAPMRVITTDDQGQEHASWVHTSPDHFYHASVYCNIAYQVLPKELPAVPFSGITKKSDWSK